MAIFFQRDRELLTCPECKSNEIYTRETACYPVKNGEPIGMQPMHKQYVCARCGKVILQKKM